MRRRVLLLVLPVLLVPVACSSGGSTPTPSPSPASTGLSAEQLRLSTLAGKAASASFDATYHVTSLLAKLPSTIRIAILRPYDVRVDVARPGVRAISLTTRAGTVSCHVTKAKTSCFLVAGPGEKVPESFQPGVDRLFSGAAEELGRSPESFDVRALKRRPAHGRLPASECFHVLRRGEQSLRPSPTPDPSGFETGDYCFSATGIPTLLKVNYGELVLVRLGARPTAKVFVPLVKPAKLPELSPSASPKPSKT